MKSWRVLPAILVATLLTCLVILQNSQISTAAHMVAHTSYVPIQLTDVKIVHASTDSQSIQIKTAQHATPVVSNATSTSTSAWNCIRRWESSGGVGNGNYTEDTGNGQYGAYEFGLVTWYFLGYTGLPSNATPATQNAAALKEYAYGERTWGNPWHAWQSAPRCGL